jgi:nitrite reductase (NADH) small subunit
MTLIDSGTWVCVAHLDDLEVNRGVAARIGSDQVALFRTEGADGESSIVYALANRDPFSGANVLSRGLVGDRAGEPKVASPIYKQSFSLRTGVCLDDPEVSVAVWSVRCRDGFVEVLLR